MRAAFGSLRLTKVIDFDRQPNLSRDSLKTGLPKALVRASANAGIKRPSAEITKLTQTTVRARRVGHASTGEALSFEVEISGRHEIPATWRRRETVAPPASYGMAPFMVETYSNDVLAAMKIAAAMSDARNAPRDIYDLQDLIAAKTNPVAILASRSSLGALEIMKANAQGKLELISFELAREELFPYLPEDVRESITEHQWLEYTLTVGASIERWCDEAIRVLRNGPKS